MSVIPVILSGGSGTRLWPLSRQHYPKQLLNLTGSSYTMLQETVIRTNHLQAPIIVCNEDHRFMVAEQCQNIGIKPSAIMLEPVGRNTAPAIALAALEAQKQDKDAIIAIFPADHVIENQKQFEQSLSTAIEAAKQDKLVTFGIVADKPETGYGYIKANNHPVGGTSVQQSELVSETQPNNDTLVGCTSVQQNEQQNESPNVGCTSVQQNEQENESPDVGCTSVQQNELTEHANRHPELVSETQPNNDTLVGCTSVQQNEQENESPDVGCTSVQQNEQENESPDVGCTSVQQNYYSVEKFVEKPDLQTAQQYIDSGDYYWNSGMFVFKAAVYLNALQQTNPKIIEYCQQALNKAQTDLDFIRVDKASFEQCPADSIDYAVMEKMAEKVNNVVVVPMNANWSDLGSWSSLWDITEKDAQGNAHIGDIIAINSTNNLVHSTNKLVATIGLSNIVIIETPDALLVADKDQVQNVKVIVEQLKIAKRSEHIQHREVHRPWGKYDSIDNGSRYQVKRITVKPGASLSLQMHYHRAEHWIVVTGSATVQIGEKEKLVTENQSVYIPIGEKHRLTNPGKLPLELIEVQSGSYLGEDDIVRFEDVFGRV